MWTESSKGTIIHVMAVFGKFKGICTHNPCSGTTSKSSLIQTPSTRSIKEQQYVLNKFIKICGCK